MTGVLVRLAGSHPLCKTVEEAAVTQSSWACTPRWPRSRKTGTWGGAVDFLDHSYLFWENLPSPGMTG